MMRIFFDFKEMEIALKPMSVFLPILFFTLIFCGCTDKGINGNISGITASVDSNLGKAASYETVSTESDDSGKGVFAMKGLYTVNDRIFRQDIEYDSMKTRVFFVKTDSGFVMIDCGNRPKDADDYIFPAMKELGITGVNLVAVLITHNHPDHTGAVDRFLEVYPDVTVGSTNGKWLESKSLISGILLQDGNIVADSLKVVEIPGHSADSSGYLELSSGTLLSGDSLQLFGALGGGCGLECPKRYMESIPRLLERDDIVNIVSSHSYYPLGNTAEGKEKVKEYLKSCYDCAVIMTHYVKEQKNAGVTDAETIGKSFTAKMRHKYGNDFPTLHTYSVKFILADY